MLHRLARQLEQIGADWCGKGGVVELHGNEGTGLLAGALPARPDFRAVVVVAKDRAVIGGILAVARFGWNERNDRVQGRRSALGRTRSRVRLADDGIGKILRPHFGRCPMAMAAKPDTACGGAGPGLVLMLVRLQIGTRRD